MGGSVRATDWSCVGYGVVWCVEVGFGVLDVKGEFVHVCACTTR